MHVVKYSRFPNNEIRVVHYYQRNRSKWIARPILLWVEFIIALLCCDVPRGVSSEASPPLDIRSDFGRCVLKNPHRRTKFGNDAKNTILRIGGAYDTVDSDPSHYVFLTGTIPGGTYDAFMAMAIQSPYVTKAIADWLKWTCPTDYWFYVWELQRRGALHIHYCVYCPSAHISDKILSKWKPKWKSIIREVGNKTSVDMWLRKDGSYHKGGHDVLQAYAQKVHKSVAAYMAGYCSSAKDKHQGDSHSPFYPKRWWGASRKSTTLLSSLTETVVSEHNDYRSAHREIQVHYERALHDSPKAYHYPHKVGIGSTCVSYHPEDKGHYTWLPLNPMLYQKTSHPNICSMIAETRLTIQAIQYSLDAYPKQLPPYLTALSKRLRAFSFPGTKYGYSIDRTVTRALAEIPCDLSSPLLVLPHGENLRKRCVLLQRAWETAAPKTLWDRRGWLVTEHDFPQGVDKSWFIQYVGTNPKGDIAVEGVDSSSGRVPGELNAPSSPTILQLGLF